MYDCRDESQWLIFIHSLYSVLPDDMIIVPTDDNRQAFGKQLTTCMLTEISEYCEFLSEADKSDVSSRGKNEAKLDAVQVREEFERRRRKMLSSERNRVQLDSGSKLFDSYHCFGNAQLETNNAACYFNTVIE